MLIPKIEQHTHTRKCRRVSLMERNIKILHTVLERTQQSTKSISHFQAGFNSGIQKWSSIRKPIHISTIRLQIKRETTHGHLHDAKKTFSKIQYPVSIKKKKVP